MATIVNTPAAQGESSSGMGFLAGMIALILFVVFLMYVVVPMLSNATRSPQIQVPDKVDVNVNQPAQ